MKKILAVDDSDVNLYLLQTILEDDKNIEIILENDSIKTIPLLHKHSPDLLILDLMMPNISGFEILELIKKDKNLEKIKIAIVSAHLNDKTLLKLKKYNIHYIFNKPLDYHRIEKTIKVILDE